MSTQVKRRRGTAAENAAFTGAIAELVFLTDSKRAAIHDAIRAGGYILPTADDLLNGALTRGTASGTNTYALTLPFFPASYSSGLEVDVTFTNANTGSCTLNVNGVGASGMKDETGTNFTTGQISAGSRFTFRHNWTEWRRVSGSSGTVKSVKRQVFTASGTYTPSTGMLFCEIECQGGGGGGRGTTDGAAGGQTAVGAPIISAAGGAGGQSAAGGAGGAGSSGDFNITGQTGGGSIPNFWASSSNGGSNLFAVTAKAGRGGNSILGLGGTDAVANTATGYGGGGSTNVTQTNDQRGGGGGGYARKLFTAATIGASQGITIGAAGSAGSGAGAGTAGIVIITEYCSQ